MFILSICQFLSGIDICLSQVLARQVVDGYPVFLPSWKHEIDDCVIADVDQVFTKLERYIYWPC